MLQRSRQPSDGTPIEKMRSYNVRRLTKKTFDRAVTNWRSCLFSVSQPKVRRVEKIVQNTKSTKEDVMKSQVYLQFIRNMDNELRRFEETEQPSTIGKLVTVLSYGKSYKKRSVVKNVFLFFVNLSFRFCLDIKKMFFFFQTTSITTVTVSHRKC